MFHIEYDLRQDKHLTDNIYRHRISYFFSVLVLSKSWSFKLRRGVAALVTAKARTFPLAGASDLLFALYIYNV